MGPEHASCIGVISRMSLGLIKRFRRICEQLNFDAPLKTTKLVCTWHETVFAVTQMSLACSFLLTRTARHKSMSFMSKLASSRLAGNRFGFGIAGRMSRNGRVEIASGHWDRGGNRLEIGRLKFGNGKLESW